MLELADAGGGGYDNWPPPLPIIFSRSSARARATKEKWERVRAACNVPVMMDIDGAAADDHFDVH